MSGNKRNSSCLFNDFDVKSNLKQKRRLAIFISNLIFHYRQLPSQFSYTFVSDDYLYEMNKQHLHHDTFTDIITFDLSEKKPSVIIADIYISIDRIKENAALEKTKYSLELLRVIIHGALHICDFDDKTKVKKNRMRLLEDEWMQKYLTY
jgi:probable rRNA maturation factor